MDQNRPLSETNWHQRKKWVAYGAGNAFLGLLETRDLPFHYIVDDTPGFAGTKLGELEIRPSKDLLDENSDDLLVVICANTARSVSGIARKLVEEFGFSAGIHFVDCSHFQCCTMSERLNREFGLLTDLKRLDRVRSLSLALRPRNLSTIAGTWLFIELLESLPEDSAGAVAECGVYQGANALISCFLSESIAKRKYSLYDSFEGLETFSSSDPQSRQGEFADVSLSEIKLLFSGFNNVEILVGRFDATMPERQKSPHAMVYIDCDLKDPTTFCCDHFWEQLLPGGFLLIHDYWFPSVALPSGFPEPFTGVREAVDQFCARQGIIPVAFPETSHVVIRKP